MKFGRWSLYLVVGVVFLLDEAYLRSHPEEHWGRRGGPVALAFFGAIVLYCLWQDFPAAWARLGRKLGWREPPFFAPDAKDAEQKAADKELERIGKIEDEKESAEAFERWLLGERFREEQRFQQRRARAKMWRRGMEQYIEDIRAELKLERSLDDPGDPDNDLGPEIRRLEVELAWAESELKHFAPN